MSLLGDLKARRKTSYVPAIAISRAQMTLGHYPSQHRLAASRDRGRRTFLVERDSLSGICSTSRSRTNGRMSSKSSRHASLRPRISKGEACVLFLQLSGRSSKIIADVELLDRAQLAPHDASYSLLFLIAFSRSSICLSIVLMSLSSSTSS